MSQPGSICRQVNSLKWVTNIYGTLKDVEMAAGNHHQALSWFEAFIVHKDSLFNSEKSRQLTEMQTRFETVEKEQQLHTQSKQLFLLQEQARFEQLLKNSLMMGIIALVTITYLIISRQRLRIKKIRNCLQRMRRFFKLNKRWRHLNCKMPGCTK